MAGETIKSALYQIYFNDSQIGNLYPFAIPHFNDQLTVFFENSVIRTIVLHSEAPKIGVCSYALKQKIGHGIPMRQEFTEEVINWDYDVLSLGRKQPEHFMLAKMDNWHPGSLEILNLIFSAIGQPTFENRKQPKDPIYQNHFMATSQIYKAYVTEMLIPAMTVMEHDDKIAVRCMEDSQYFKLKTEPGYPKLIKEKLGMDYVPLHTFLCERMFSCWIHGKDIKVKYL
jgi:hypothetical protein